MPDYSFNLSPYVTGFLGEIEKRKQEDEQAQMLAQLSNAQQPLISEQTEMPEQRGGKDMVNSVMENVIPQAPNPYQINLQRNILATKKNYADAKNDSGRQAAHDAAELWRTAGNAAGLDLSGYGTDVSLDDAYKNLASQEARDITAALQGAYSMNSDQYYEQKYDEALMRGFNRRRAQRLAGAQAREYQARRVAYLDGLYNSYGRDGLVTSGIGNQIIGMMANENPTLANFYAQIYPNAKDAFTRQNQIEDKVLD